MKPNIQLEHVYLDDIRRIMAAYSSAVAFIFGSRVNGTAKKFSDIDLCIDWVNSPPEAGGIASLREDFDESSIPYIVDVVDYLKVSADFRQVIDANKLALSDAIGTSTRSF